MPSHGAAKSIAADMPPAPRKMPKVLEHVQLTKAENGGVVAEHRFTHYEHKPETHVFAGGDGHKLAAHIEQHLGIKMPGRSTGTVASPAEGEAGKDESE